MIYSFEKSGKLKEPTATELKAADGHYATVVLDQGFLEDGTHYWAYLAIKPSKYKEYKRMVSSRKPIKLTDYGEILKGGFGKSVPPSIYEEMKRKYNLDENFLTVLAEKISQARIAFLKIQENQRLSDIVAMLKSKQPV